MTKKLISIMIVVACLQSLAHAQAYRCQSPNGTISFQDRPCQKGETESESNLKLMQQPPDKKEIDSRRPRRGLPRYLCSLPDGTFYRRESPCDGGGYRLRP